MYRVPNFPWSRRRTCPSEVVDSPPSRERDPRVLSRFVRRLYLPNPIFRFPAIRAKRGNENSRGEAHTPSSTTKTTTARYIRRRNNLLDLAETRGELVSSHARSAEFREGHVGHINLQTPRLLIPISKILRAGKENYYSARRDPRENIDCRRQP